LDRRPLPPVALEGLEADA